MKRASGVPGQAKLIARHIRTAGLNLIVLRDAPRAPDVMLVVVGSVELHQIGLVVVRRLIQITVGLQKARLIESLALVITHREFNERLIEVAQFRRERVADVLVCDNDLSRDSIRGLNGETAAIERRDEFLRTRSWRLSPQGKDIDAQRVSFQKLVHRVELFGPFVKNRNRRVCCGPAM